MPANAVNDELIKEGQQNILSYFQKKGYFDAKVDVKVDQTATGTSIVYNIQKDGRFKVDADRYQWEPPLQRQGTAVASQRAEGQQAVVLARRVQPKTGSGQR